MKKDLESLGLKLVDEGAKLESAQVEVCIDEVEESKIVYEQTDFSVSSSSHVTTFGVRALVNQRLGFITTNNLNEENIATNVREVQSVARLSPQNPHYKFSENAKGKYELFNSSLSEMAPKELLSYAQLFIDECRKDPRVLIDRAEISLSNSGRYLINNLNVNQFAKQSLVNWYVMGMASENGEVTSFDYDGNNAGNINDIEPRLKETAQLFRESVLGSLGAEGCKSYQGPVLLHPAAVGDLLAGVIAFNVNGRAQQDGMSKWKDVVNTLVASEKLTIVECPQDKTRAASWTPFDREGVPAVDRPVVKDGVLKLTAHNCFSASRAGVAPTGHASGGSRSTPGIGLHTLSVQKGTATMKDLNSALGNGLVLKRFSGNADPVSGSFSGVAKNSWWVENGQRTKSIKEVMISGNMFELLKSIKLVGTDVIRQSGSFDSPYILVDGVSVTG